MKKLLGRFMVSLALTVGALFIMGTTDLAAQPSLTIADQVPALPGDTVDVQITFAADGNSISSLTFSVDFDQTLLTFDSTDNDQDGNPDAVSFNVPAAFSPTVNFDANDTDGELDFTIADFAPPLAALVDDIVVTITFTVGTPVSATSAAVIFSEDPPASFGTTTGQQVAGDAIDGSVLITVPENIPPVATDQEVATAVNTPVDITLAGSDADADTLTFSIVDQPANGTLSGTPPNVTYTPNADFTGDDTFTFVANDGTDDSDPVTVTIAVQAGSANPPIAQDDTATTPAGTTVNVRVLTNDSDVDNNELTVTDVTAPANGTAVIAANNTRVRYTPNSGFIGVDTLTYTVSDGTGNTDTATLTVTVSPGTAVVGANSPDPNTPIDISGVAENVPLLQILFTTGEEDVNLNSVTVNVSGITGDQTVAEMFTVNLVNDANGNGQVNAGEDVLATQQLTDLTANITLTIDPAFNVPAMQSTNLLVALTVAAASDMASVLAPQLPTPGSALGWLVVLPSVVGLLLCRRLRRRAPRLYVAVVILLFCCSLALTGCDDDDGDGGGMLSFTVAVPQSGVGGTGATSGQPVTAPVAPIAGPVVTVSP